MNNANVPAGLGVARDLRGAERRTSGVNFLARTVILRRRKRKRKSGMETEGKIQWRSEMVEEKRRI